jgi:hypothetical protein
MPIYGMEISHLPMDATAELLSCYGTQTAR